MIEFRDGDEVIGRAAYRDGVLVALDPAVQSYVDGWVNRRRPPQDFETFYDGWANGYANARRVDDDLVAAAEVHTGAMVALVPSEEDAERIAVDGGEDADQLHVTLVYLGEAALLPPEVREDLIDSASRWAETFPTIIGKAFAIDMFNPPDLTAGAEPCVVLGIGGDLVANAHEVMLQSANAILGGYGIPLPQQHRPWVAHLTLLYTDDADVRYFTDRIGPVTFDRLRLAFGGDVYDIPLGDAAGDDNTMMEPGAPEESETL